MEETQEQKEKKLRLIKICIYLGIFALAIIIVRFTGNTGLSTSNNDSNETSNQSNAIISKLTDIDEKYYSSKVHLTLDDDAITLNYEKVDTIEMGVKKYHGVEKEYIKNDQNYYKFENGEFIKLNDFKEFEYDRTFINISNIKKLLALKSEDYNYYTGENQALKKVYDLRDAYKIYNEYNNTSFINYDEGQITLEIIYKDNEIILLNLDITDFYNSLNKKDLEKVNYEMTFKNEKQEDISWILEKLN